MRTSNLAVTAATTLAVLALALPAAAHAEDAPGLRDFCAERPGSTTPPCIVDVGHVLAELDLLDVTRIRQDGGGWAQTTAALSPHLRFGLTERMEAGFMLQPYVQQRVGGPGGGAVSGFGDATANLKISLRNPDGSGLSVAVLPYVSIPLAQRGLGAGGFQGGVLLPTQLALPDGFSLSLSPEVDVLRSAGGGTHGAYLGAVSVAHALGGGVTGAVELVSSVGESADPHARITVAGGNFNWIPSAMPNLQLDVGADAGLSRSAPALRAYVGVSRRF